MKGGNQRNTVPFSSTTWTCTCRRRTNHQRSIGPIGRMHCCHDDPHLRMTTLSSTISTPTFTFKVWTKLKRNATTPPKPFPELLIMSSMLRNLGPGQNKRTPRQKERRRNVTRSSKPFPALQTTCRIPLNFGSDQ